MVVGTSTVATIKVAVCETSKYSLKSWGRLSSRFDGRCQNARALFLRTFMLLEAENALLQVFHDKGGRASPFV